MINFLRKLRRNQKPSSSERTRAGYKYLKHALGEISLVVIGILIALAIDNANEDRKDREKLHGYLDKISHSVKADLEAIQDLAEYRQSTKQASEILLKRISHEEFLLDTVVQNGLQKAFVQQYFSPNVGAYESLINSGHLELLKSEEILQLLPKYYNTTQDLAKEEDIFNRFLEALETELAKDGTLKLIFPIERPDLVPPISQDDFRARLKTFFEHPSTFTMLTSYLRIDNLENYYNQLDSLGNLMITEIGKEIKR